MKCKCTGNVPEPIVTHMPTTNPYKIAEKLECPQCFQREYAYKYLAEEGIIEHVTPRLLGTGALLCHSCNTMSGVLVLHNGSLKCIKCKNAANLLPILEAEEIIETT